MTKAQLKEAYKAWNREISQQHFEEKDKIFKELQELNAEYGNGKKYCSASENMKHLIGSSKEWKAIDLYNRYNQIDGAFKALTDLALATQNFKIN